MKCILLYGIIIATFATISTFEITIAPALTVSIYYETHCSDSRDFIMKQLYPTFYKVQQYFILNLVPFGKAKSMYDGFICQHGNKECLGNTIDNCVLHRIQDPLIQVAYVNCAMEDPDRPEYSEEMCIKACGVSIEQVKQCYTSQEGYELMINAELETKSMTPGPKFVPTIVFDNEYNDDDQINAYEHFESTLCRKLFNRGFTDLCLNGVIVDSKILSNNIVLTWETLNTEDSIYS